MFAFSRELRIDLTTLDQIVKKFEAFRLNGKINL
jgi:hypothetical protein